MATNIEKAVREVSETIRAENISDLSYIGLSLKDPQTGACYTALELRIGPLQVFGGVEHFIAKKVAEKYHVNFKEYNVNIGTEEPPLYVPVFYAIFPDPKKRDIKGLIKDLMDAHTTLKNNFQIVGQKLVNLIC